MAVVLAETATAVELRITDDGPGTPAELLPRVTERFVRGSSGRSTVSGSSGLGLSVAAGIVAAHHGRLAVSSSPAGTEVTLPLPATAPDRQDAGTPAGQPVVAGLTRCLIGWPQLLDARSWPRISWGNRN